MKVIVVSDEQWGRWVGCVHTYRNIAFASNGAGWATLGEILKALEAAQPGVVVTGAEALMLVELLDDFFIAKRANMTGQVVAAYLKLKGWNVQQKAPSEAQAARDGDCSE